MSPGGWTFPRRGVSGLDGDRAILVGLQGFESEKSAQTVFSKKEGLLYEALMASSRWSTLSWPERPSLGTLGPGWELSGQSLPPHFCPSLPAGFIPLSLCQATFSIPQRPWLPSATMSTLLAAAQPCGETNWLCPTHSFLSQIQIFGRENR